MTRSSAKQRTARRTSPAATATGCAKVRACAALVLGRVLGARQSLTALLPEALSQAPRRERSLLQELCYGVLRWYPQLQFLLDQLLDKPLRVQEQEVRALLLLGLYQILHLRVPDYAAVSEAVAAARDLDKPWATRLINGVLRSFLRRRDELLTELERNEVARSAHPGWLLERLRSDWPEDWPALIAANNARPPQSLRVNTTRLSRTAYLEQLAAAGVEAAPSPVTDTGITLAEPCEVEQLPGFQEGSVSVQDVAAQLAAQILELRPGQRVLDACAAPGGKTGHILETEPEVAHLLALDCDGERLAKARENLHRLGLQAELRVGDALQPDTWWNGLPYDRILLDAPCSGTGVIRRHPDIKVLRTPADIDRLAERQRMLLESLWPLLIPGGILIYATCSLLKQENEQVVGEFLTARPDAWEKPIDAAWGRIMRHGRQVLPGEAGMDGFFYARLVKREDQQVRV